MTQAANTTAEPESRRKKSVVGAVIVLGVFGTIFAGFGIAAMVEAFHGMRSSGGIRALPLLLGGISFTAFGLCIFWFTSFVARISRDEAAMQAQFPNEPWLWNKQWASKSIPEEARGVIVLAWIVAIAFNSIVWTAAVVILADAKSLSDKTVYTVLIFPASGLFLLWWPLYLTSRRRKFGRSRFELETLPGNIGGWIGGTILTSKPYDGSEAIRIELRCVSSVIRNSGGDSNTTQTIIWQDHQILSGRLPREGMGMALPVAFQIPADCRPTFQSPQRSITWRVVASASVRGVDYKTTFVVPVFAIETPDTTLPRAEILAAKVRAAPPPISELAEQANIGFTVDAAGRENFDFPPARNLKPALFLFVMGAVMGGVGVVIGKFDGPGFLSTCFGIVGGLCLLGVTFMLFKGRSIRITQDAVELRWHMLGLSGTCTIPRASITGVTSRATSQFGGTSYFTLQLTTSDGKSITVASGLLSEQVKWVAAELTKILGVGLINKSEILSAKDIT